MVDFADALGASKAASTLLVLFIPNRDRTDQPIDQGYWVDETLNTLGTLFGGATAYPQGKGVWRDDAQGGKLLFDEPVVIQCYTSEQAIESRAAPKAPPPVAGTWPTMSAPSRVAIVLMFLAMSLTSSSCPSAASVPVSPPAGSRSPGNRGR